MFFLTKILIKTNRSQFKLMMMKPKREQKAHIENTNNQ